MLNLRGQRRPRILPLVDHTVVNEPQNRLPVFGLDLREFNADSLLWQVVTYPRLRHDHGKVPGGAEAQGEFGIWRNLPRDSQEEAAASQGQSTNGVRAVFRSALNGEIGLYPWVSAEVGLLHPMNLR
jgi:hypothetical protein